MKNRNTSKRRRKAINIFNKWRGLSWHDFLLFWNNLKAMHQSISLLMLSHSFNVFQNIGKKKKKEEEGWRLSLSSWTYLQPTFGRLCLLTWLVQNLWSLFIGICQKNALAPHFQALHLFILANKIVFDTFLIHFKVSHKIIELYGIKILLNFKFKEFYLIKYVRK